MRTEKRDYSTATAMQACLMPAETYPHISDTSDAETFLTRLFGFPQPERPHKTQVCVLYCDNDMNVLFNRFWTCSDFKGVNEYLRDMIHTGLNVGAVKLVFGHYSPCVSSTYLPDGTERQIAEDNFKSAQQIFASVGMEVCLYLFYDRDFLCMDIFMNLKDYFI
jgi:hypothetical protein